MFFRCIPVGIFQANCYILADPDTKEGVVIDPGAQADVIIGIIEKYQLKIKAIINTHGHPDHIAANLPLQEYTKAPLMIHKNDEWHLADPLPMPFPGAEPTRTPLKADIYLEENVPVKFGSYEIKVIDTPGHSEGGVCLLVGNKLFTGDTLFAGTVGRVDLPGGSESVLLKSIREKLLILPDELEIYPGHGPSSTLGQEKQNNPYCQM